MIVGHAEPILPLTLWRYYIVRGIQIYFAIKDTSRRVRSKLILDNRILCHCSSSEQAESES